MPQRDDSLSAAQEADKVRREPGFAREAGFGHFPSQGLGLGDHTSSPMARIRARALLLVTTPGRMQ